MSSNEPNHRLQAVQRYLTGSPRRTASRRSDPVTSVLDPAPPGGRRERRESATDVRLHGDEMAADADDGDADHATAANMTCLDSTLVTVRQPGGVILAS
jgi:hypothetical protein